MIQQLHSWWNSSPVNIYFNWMGEGFVISQINFRESQWRGKRLQGNWLQNPLLGSSSSSPLIARIINISWHFILSGCFHKNRTTSFEYDTLGPSVIYLFFSWKFFFHFVLFLCCCCSDLSFSLFLWYSFSKEPLIISSCFCFRAIIFNSIPVKYFTNNLELVPYLSNLFCRFILVTYQIDMVVTMCCIHIFSDQEMFHSFSACFISGCIHLPLLPWLLWPVLRWVWWMFRKWVFHFFQMCWCNSGLWWAGLSVYLSQW